MTVPEPPAATRVKGIPLRVLIDRREHFLPDMMFRFFEYAVRQPEARFYKEAEIIWQAVSETTWRELRAYTKALAIYCKQVGTRLEQRSSWNIFSPDVWAAWLELKRFYLGERGLCNDYWRIIKYSGYLINALRDRFISQYNAKHPKLDPPLRRSDNLILRLGSLPSFRKDRVAYFQTPDPTPGPSGFLWGELDHFKRRGGIVFDGKTFPTDFDVVTDTRPNFMPKDDEILGIAALLPTCTDSESQETDSGSHGSQGRTDALFISLGLCEGCGSSPLACCLRWMAQLHARVMLSCLLTTLRSSISFRPHTTTICPLVAVVKLHYTVSQFRSRIRSRSHPDVDRTNSLPRSRWGSLPPSSTQSHLLSDSVCIDPHANN
ncbi:BQ5605_C012g06950 [Microbotryum silenes-dioicae]|uniref:BQ5605_C012g06950 protein n=1 Tax=Microbotryum silenes-dioicae TaxID=796604 RepID=A0A2X0NVJ5_9BASI|nr:BQ5605_C012g06950 [Microbotryum silenes-dioicae]